MVSTWARFILKIALNQKLYNNSHLLYYSNNSIIWSINMTEYILSINGYLYILFLSLTLLAQFPILKKFKLIFSFYDPLLMYFIFNSFSVAFVIYLFFDNLIEFIYLVTFLISNVFFILGLILGNKKIKHENINIKYSDITI